MGGAQATEAPAAVPAVRRTPLRRLQRGVAWADVRGRWCPVALTVALLLDVSACTGSPVTREPTPSAASGRPVASAASSPRGSPQRATAVPFRQVLRGSSRWRLRQPAKLREIEGYVAPGSVAPGQSL